MIPHTPNFTEFQQLAQDARMVPVYRQLVSDTLTPVLAYCKLQWGAGSFLFESVVGGEKIGRYSFLGADPFLQIEAFGKRVTITQNDTSETFDSDDPLDELEKLLQKYPGVHVPGLPRFTGGAVGYAGYDSVRYTEHLPNAPEDDRHLPDLSFAFYDRMVVFDHVRKTVLVIVTANTEDKDNLQDTYDSACDRVDEICRQLQRGVTDLQLTDIDPKAETPSKELKSNRPPNGYQETVEGIKEYIRAGDVFQVVPSERWELQTQARPIDIYRSLRVVNPSPFMFLLRTPACTLIGSSPEIMVRVEDGETTIRPLAGTRRRGATEAEDRALAEELLADPKERAEHVMLIDLARNDVGRIAEYGSVKLSDVMVVERYSHVMHITSNVTGQLKPGLTALDALRAGLPAGTVSGAPKVRAMEIIDEFETTRRGPYGGAVGYLDFTGDMDTCIALRTMVMQGQTVYLQAGGGIVADSDPEAEYQEICNKARGLLKAIEVAEAQL